MSLARAIPRIAACLALAACAGAPEFGLSEQYASPMPYAVRTGAADMVIEAAAPDIAREEVLDAVQRLVADARLCRSWPLLWIEDEGRHNTYLVRYDLMARDWGQDIASASAARMQEFVDLGFLEQRTRPDIGVGAVEYDRTASGGEFLVGSPYAGSSRPEFCAPSQRRVIEITRMEWGRFPCGTLLVEFTHVADAWPTWASTEEARARVAAQWAPPQQVLAGSVSLSRLWFRRGQAPFNGARNGELHSLCYDEGRERLNGDDLNLQAGDG